MNYLYLSNIISYTYHYYYYLIFTFTQTVVSAIYLMQFATL
jgi:hypothetical protein